MDASPIPIASPKWNGLGRSGHRQGHQASPVLDANRNGRRQRGRGRLAAVAMGTIARLAVGGLWAFMAGRRLGDRMSILG
jgi:hypothetical protein